MKNMECKVEGTILHIAVDLEGDAGKSGRGAPLVAKSPGWTKVAVVDGREIRMSPVYFVKVKPREGE